MLESIGLILVFVVTIILCTIVPIYFIRRKIVRFFSNEEYKVIRTEWIPINLFNRNTSFKVYLWNKKKQSSKVITAYSTLLGDVLYREG